jgi:hypothetical protein
MNVLIYIIKEINTQSIILQTHAYHSGTIPIWYWSVFASIILNYEFISIPAIIVYNQMIYYTG